MYINKLMGDNKDYTEAAEAIAKGLDNAKNNLSKEDCRVYLESVTCICGHHKLDHHPSPNNFCAQIGCKCEKLVLQKDR